LTLESLNRFGFPLDRDLHAAVRQVLHPSVQPFPRCERFGEETKPYALNAAADEIATGYAHAERVIIPLDHGRSRNAKRAARSSVVMRY
jgi:hypothetical protein